MKYKTIPEDLLESFTLNGQIPVTYEYLDNAHDESDPFYWDQNMINYYIQLAKAKRIMAYEDDRFLYLGLNKYHSRIFNKTVGVIGSTRPCYECILLSYGAHPVTVEYAPIICNDPRMKIFTVKEFEKNPQMFDAILSVSSIEHDGLGRYGDPLNPDGDFMFMEKAKTLIPKDGLFFLQVPVAKDSLVFNMHRIYGKIRLPILLKGWRVLDIYGLTEDMLEKEGGIQPLFVLTPE